MSALRRTPVRRFVTGAVELLGDRAPWLSDHAYRVVAAPLQWVDPAGGARVAEARLDDVRDRVSAMASSGRVGRSEQRRIERDLTRTREDLARIVPRLPAVQARALTLRLTAYAEALEALPGRPVARSRPTRARDAVLVTGTAAAAWTGMLLPVAGTVAVEGGLAAGVVTALGVTVTRSRRARKERIGAVAATLARVDEAARGPNGVDVRVLDHDRRALLRRAAGSGRLDRRGAETLRRIDAHLDDLLLRLADGVLEAGDSHLVQAAVTRYLPDTLEPFLALTDPRVVVRGRPAAVEVADHLASIESGLAEAAGRPAPHQPERLLLLQGEFLRSRFGESSG